MPVPNYPLPRKERPPRSSLPGLLTAAIAVLVVLILARKLTPWI